MSRLNIPRQARKRARVGAFGAADSKRHKSVIGFSTASVCYNFDAASGALREGFGVAAHDAVPEDAVRYYMYKYYSEKHGCFVDQYVYQERNGFLMFYEPAYGFQAYLTSKPYPPMHALNYRLNSQDILLLSCEGCKLMVWDGNYISSRDSPTISSMALHYERLFVTSNEQPTRVFFSENLDPTNFDISADGGGFIELLDERGDLNKVVSFGSYLYIFRDHGISRVTAYGDQREFSVVNLFVTAGRIYPTSIATCGNIIMFLASDGIYAFDGYECVRVLTNLDGLVVPSENCVGEFFDGRYYLSCEMTIDGERGNGLVVYECAVGDHSVSFGPNITFLNSVTYNGEDILVCCADNVGGVVKRNGCCFDAPLEKRWTGPETDFGAPDSVKTVREIYIGASVPVTITLFDGSKKKTAFVKAGYRRVRMNFCARRFSVTVTASAAECEITPLTVIYSAN